MKKIISILLILVGIISIGSGCYLMFADSDDDNIVTDEKKEETEDTIISVSNIKDFSEYSSYQIDVDYDGITYGTLKYDSNNNNMYFSMLESYYMYYDITNDITYISEDGSTWTLSDDSTSIEITDTNEISEVITMIKNGNATDNGDNSYSLSITDEDNDCDASDPNNDCPDNTTGNTYIVIVSFDSNGYIKTMTINDDEGTTTYAFSDVNNTTIDVIDTSSITTATDNTSDTTITE